MAALSAAAAFKTTANVAAAKAEAAGVAAQLGYVNSSNLTVTVNSPPLSGPNTANLSAVEVILTLQQSPLLTRVFRDAPYTIRTRSVSRPGSGSGGCILALATTAAPAITINGNSAATLTGCNVYSNSNASVSINTSGGGTLVADDVYSVGGIYSVGITANLHPYDQPQADPYASVPDATVVCPTAMPSTITGPATIQPGAYCNGLKLKSGSITMAPGTYIIAGGPFNVASQASVDATAGVTIITAAYNNYIYSASVAGGATFKITAPKTGTYAGIAFFADRSMGFNNNIITSFDGQSNLSVTGAIYAPTSFVTYAGGSSGANGCTQIVAQTVKLTGGSAISANCGTTGTKTIGAVLQTTLVD